MAKRIGMLGLASLVVVDSAREIDDLMEHPGLERSFQRAGPIVNRLLVGALQRQFLRPDGHMLMSMRPRQDPERVMSQVALATRLDALAAEKAWAPEAIYAMAHYVATGAQFVAAASALTYVTAFPFLQSSQRGGYDPQLFGKVFRLTRRIARANSLVSPLGMLIRLTRGDRRAQRALRKLTGGNDYGLHALTASIDNSLVILENLKQFARESRGQKRSPTHPLSWLSARTAPVLVLRQVKERFFLPHVKGAVPPFTLALLCMRRSLRPDSAAGFEFAADHWSACPARGYLIAVFEAVCERAGPWIAAEAGR